MTAYGVNSQGSMPGKGKRFFSIPLYQDRLWDPPPFYLYHRKVSMELRNHLGPNIMIRSYKMSIIERKSEEECLKSYVFLDVTLCSPLKVN
jgi:hypothetical protein